MRGLMDLSLQTIALWAVPVVLAITLHEAAHGYVARMFGDQTAWMLGRVTLNPLKHIDPVGTILVPGALMLLPRLPAVRFHLRLGEAGAGEFRQPAQPEARHALGGGAGPAANFVMAVAVGPGAQGSAAPSGPVRRARRCSDGTGRHLRSIWC